MISIIKDKYDSVPVEIKRLIQSLISIGTLILVFTGIFLLSSNGIIPILNISYLGSTHIVNPITLLTSIFYHSSNLHLTSDSNFLFVTGIPFFYRYQMKKGITLYIVIGTIANFLSYLIISLFSLVLLVNGVNIFFEIDGMGSSAASIGVATISIIIMTKKLKIIKNYINANLNTVFTYLVIVALITIVIVDSLSVVATIMTDWYMFSERLF